MSSSVLTPSPLYHAFQRRFALLAAWIYALILILLNFIRIFDDAFWIDEAHWTLGEIDKSFAEVISVMSSSDIHLPLYFIILKAFVLFLGHHGWVYHLVSLIPCLILLPFCLTLFRKRFGLMPAILLMTFIALSPASVHYNVEVRMYSWAMFFLAMAFYQFYILLIEPHRINYLWFGLFCLCSCFTHCYCIPAVGILYLALFIKCLKNNRGWLYYIITVALSALCCLPWFTMLARRSATYASNEAWQTWAMVPSFSKAMNYMLTGGLDYDYYKYIGFSLSILLCVAIAKCARCCFRSISEKDIHSLNTTARYNGRTIAYFMLTGLSCIICTYLTGVTLSLLLTPLLIKRYLFPVSIIGWMIVSVSILTFRRQVFLFATILSVLLICFIPEYIRIYNIDMEIAKKSEHTISIVSKLIRPEDEIITFGVNAHLYHTSKYYFPNNKIISYDQYNTNIPYSSMHLDNLSRDKIYYIFTSDTWLPKEKHLNMKYLKKSLEKDDFSCRELIHGGGIGNYNTNIYVVRYNKQTKGTEQITE